MVYPNNSDRTDKLELDPADGQPYIDELQVRLLESLSPAQTIEEVDERLRKLYPSSKLVESAIQYATASTKQRHNHKVRHHSTSLSSSTPSSASFTGALHKIQSFAVAKVSNLVKNENELTKYKISLIQYIIDEVLKLAEKFVRNQENSFLITRSDIRTAMHADEDLVDMFLCEDKSLMITENHPILSHFNCQQQHQYNTANNNNNNNQNRSITYKQKVENMVDSENSFICGLNLIIKVFRAQLEKLPLRDEVEVLFRYTDDLLMLSMQLLTVLEDALESEFSLVGSEILDLVKAEEFNDYFKFAKNRLNREWKEAYRSIITNESTMTSLRTAGQQFDLAVKYLLPNYLLNAIIQFFEFYKNIAELHELSKSGNYGNDDKLLSEAISILLGTKKLIENLIETKLTHEDEVEQLEFSKAEEIRKILEKRLYTELHHLPYMPPIEMYRFSEPDSKDNILLDHDEMIRKATLTKLIERLTYHKFQEHRSDEPNIVDTFLTTYRSFIADPMELLDLLIERFKIPNPPVSSVLPDYQECTLEELMARDRLAYIQYRQYIKRFCQLYSRPVKKRVINVFKSWIRNHYYDFERNPALLERMNSFLDEVYASEEVLRSWIDPIKKSIEQKKTCQQDRFEIMLSKDPPAVLWGTAKDNEPEKFDILTLHPLEFARQLTLIEYDLFRAIKISELNNFDDLGLRSRKEDKSELSPNLSRLTKHFTLLSYWIRKCIVETEDFNKRAAIYNRAIEIMVHLRKLNNFNGLLSIGSAIESAPVDRLAHTQKKLSKTAMKVMEDYRDLNRDHQRKLQFELKNCNPPCIPYIGLYQTMLIQANEGNETFTKFSPTFSYDGSTNSSFSCSPATPISPRTPLPYSGSTLNRTSTTSTSPLSATSTLQNQFFGGSMQLTTSPPPVNFAKQRIRAKLLAQISIYQNLPYCFRVQPEIKSYIESIDDEMIEFANVLDSAPRLVDSNKGKKFSQEHSITALTKLLDDYLFEQSKRIEPKNCTKPTSKSKLPDLESGNFFKRLGQLNINSNNNFSSSNNNNNNNNNNHNHNIK